MLKAYPDGPLSGIENPSLTLLFLVPSPLYCGSFFRVRSNVHFVHLQIAMCVAVTIVIDITWVVIIIVGGATLLCTSGQTLLFPRGMAQLIPAPIPAPRRQTSRKDTGVSVDGFECKFLVSPSEDLLCVLCNLLMSSPLAFPCCQRAIMCQSCAELLNACPICGTKFGKSVYDTSSKSL